ncbi:hypothetical protein HIM_05596 [Hirsutella minnesotensis 3608]|uniref:Uncharacterized protein n=1 Tax=Hirsutella minnesotensis 3608 TaxID=1043627 RepID=A0A0F7ZP95_9HYPO|nr:hypothetical protein HIM_05596 [Hirsutella minnesotensis 3608]
MASPALIPALPPTLSEPGGELPVDSADEFSESDDCDDFHDNDDWDGQPWEVEFPSDSPLLTTSYESFDRLLDVLKAFCIQKDWKILWFLSETGVSVTFQRHREAVTGWTN